MPNGDVNGDNYIDGGDFGVVEAAYNSGPGDPNWNPDADLNGDLWVDMGDFMIVVKNYNQCGVPPFSGNAQSASGSCATTGIVELEDWLGDPQPVTVQIQSEEDPSVYYTVNATSGQVFTVNLPQPAMYAAWAEVWHWLGENATIDLMPPTPGTASVAAYTSNSQIAVTYSGAYDNCDGTPGSGLKQVQLWYKAGASGGWTNSGLISTGASGTFAFSPPGNQAGNYYFGLVAVDNAGNQSAEVSGNGGCSTYYEAALGICQFSSILGP